MPHKYPKKKGWHVPKQKYKVTNWSEYTAALKRRGDVEIWLSADTIFKWYEQDRNYDGTGTPKLFTDFAITICHENRQVYHLPLRQTQGFIDSLFRRMGIPLRCPDYTCLSKRLRALGLKVPRYQRTDKMDESIEAVAIDSTGLKRFGRGEWHQEKYELSRKASWRKLHVAVDEGHYIQACELTDRFSHDEKSVDPLLSQIHSTIQQVTADGAYDKSPVYQSILMHSPDADIVIPPQENAALNEQAAPMRNRNIQEIESKGRMAWQGKREYGRRNYSELAIQRYKRIIGDTMRAREFERQKMEAMIGCGILNKMTSLGMPVSYRSV